MTRFFSSLYLSLRIYGNRRDLFRPMFTLQEQCHRERVFQFPVLQGFCSLYTEEILRLMVVQELRPKCRRTCEANSRSYLSFIVTVFCLATIAKQYWPHKHCGHLCSGIVGATMSQCHVIVCAHRTETNEERKQPVRLLLSSNIPALHSYTFCVDNFIFQLIRNWNRENRILRSLQAGLARVLFWINYNCRTAVHSAIISHFISLLRYNSSFVLAATMQLARFSPRKNNAFKWIVFPSSRAPQGEVPPKTAARLFYFTIGPAEKKARAKRKVTLC